MNAPVLPTSIFRETRDRIERELQHLHDLRDPEKLRARIAELEAALAMMGPA